MLKLAFIGILAAIALPDYSKLRDRAETGVRVAEAIGLAKECALAAASNLNEDVTGSANIRVNPVNGCTGGGTVDISFAAGRGVQCLDKILSDEATNATITISNTGAISCSTPAVN